LVARRAHEGDALVRADLDRALAGLQGRR
jgi:hypothetical protein